MSREEEITRVLKQHGERLRHLETVERSAAGTSAHKDTHDPQTGIDPLDCGAPTTILAQDTAPAESASDEFARNGHVHGIDVGIPSDVGVANAEGGSTEFVRKDHVHNHPGLAIEPFDGHLNNPCARVYHSVAQATVSGVSLALAFDSERFDTDVMHDNVINNSRLTCKTAGKYLIIGCADIDANATGDREIYIRLGGATYIAADARRAPATKDAHMNLSVIYDLAVNEYVELLVRQDSGGPLNSEAWPNAIPEFMMVRIG